MTSNSQEEENLLVIFGGDLFHVRQKVDIFDFNTIFRIVANHPKVETYLLRDITLYHLSPENTHISHGRRGLTFFPSPATCRTDGYNRMK